MHETHYRLMFFVGAAWNLLGGVAVITLTPWIFGAAGTPPPHPPVFYQSWIALFMTFGVGYYMVGRDPRQNRAIVVLGLIGKLAFIAVYVANRACYGNVVPLLFAIPAAGDLVFAVLFAIFLIHNAREVERT